MKFRMLKLMLLMHTLSVFGCASNWTWELVSKDNNQLDFAGLAIQLPNNWVVYNKHFNKYYARTKDGIKEKIVNQTVISRNGLELDGIRIFSFNSSYAFPSIGQSAGETLLPSELAERFLAEQKAIADSIELHVSKSEPYEISGQTGFRVSYEMTNSDGINFKHNAVGFSVNNNFYVFVYRASSIHYYEAGLPSFESLLGSIQMSG